MESFSQQVQPQGLPWLPPHVTSSQEGKIVFEWWNGTRQLTIYIEAERADFIQMGELDGDGPTCDGDAMPQDTRHKLWLWLMQL